MDFVEIWRAVLGELQITISKANFSTWFRNTFIIEGKKGIYTIGVPSIFIEKWLRDKYSKEITAALKKQIDDEILGIKFKVATPRPEQIINIEKAGVIHRAVDKPPVSSSGFVSQTLGGKSTLKESYRFDNFIVGQSNQLAFAAAKAVADKEISPYNPLYIYGESGLGKTHLMQAIGNAHLKKDPSKNIIYVSSETFVNDFIQSVSAGMGKAKDFKNRYRNVDMLLIDDIQFLGTKEQTQDEFFHTFNHLHQNQKQVVLASDRPPREIKGLEARLKTRFEGGMVCDISKPDLETREAILGQKLKQMNREMDKDTIAFIAQNIDSSVRELEGALNKVFAVCDLKNEPVTTEAAADILDKILQDRRRIITPDLIIREVHKYYRIPIEELIGAKRTKDLVLPRQITMYLMRSECGASFPIIGREMGGKDHSTIMHGVKKIESCVSTDPRLKEDIAFIKNKIYSMLG